MPGVHWLPASPTRTMEIDSRKAFRTPNEKNLRGGRSGWITNHFSTSLLISNQSYWGGGNYLLPGRGMAAAIGEILRRSRWLWYCFAGFGFPAEVRVALCFLTTPATSSKQIIFFFFTWEPASPLISPVGEITTAFRLERFPAIDCSRPSRLLKWILAASAMQSRYCHIRPRSFPSSTPLSWAWLNFRAVVGDIFSNILRPAFQIPVQHGKSWKIISIF